jgi:hypothetical protein
MLPLMHHTIAQAPGAIQDVCTLANSCSKAPTAAQHSLYGHVAAAAFAHRNSLVLATAE